MILVNRRTEAARTIGGLGQGADIIAQCTTDPTLCVNMGNQITTSAKAGLDIVTSIWDELTTWWNDIGNFFTVKGRPPWDFAVWCAEIAGVPTLNPDGTERQAYEIEQDLYDRGYFPFWYEKSGMARVDHVSLPLVLGAKFLGHPTGKETRSDSYGPFWSRHYGEWYQYGAKKGDWYGALARVSDMPDGWRRELVQTSKDAYESGGIVSGLFGPSAWPALLRLAQREGRRIGVEIGRRPTFVQKVLPRSITAQPVRPAKRTEVGAAAKWSTGKKVAVAGAVAAGLGVLGTIAYFAARALGGGLAGYGRWQPPRTQAERRALPARCFVAPETRQFPICPRGSTSPSCEGLRAALTRASQFRPGLRADVYRRAERLGCTWG